MEKKRSWLALLALVLGYLFVLISSSPIYGQDENSEDPAYVKARQLLTRLTSEEKVGQLFLVTMDGREAGENSPIYELITEYHIGGVILKRDNDNFSDDPDILNNTFNLTSRLQAIESNAANQILTTDSMPSLNDYIPLFIGLSQSGDVNPYDQIISGLTPIPSQMAIGATWNPGLAESAGEILGGELSSLGFNFLLGPSLDVSESTSKESKDDLGVRTFGGDPFWVGEMGKSFISGVKTGSNGRLAVIAKNFPGRGGSDRLPEEEVSTVRKSLEQLKLIELAPFFEVTDLINSTANSISDGLLINHIRYQGFQGNIRATTKPVSFDQTAIEQLMGLEPFAAWRKSGGLLVSDDLGSQAVHRFFNPSGKIFDGRQIARNAFLAGNDVLYMDELVSSGDENRFATYKQTIKFLIQKYQEDQAFAAKVDASVTRILALKYNLYTEFDPDLVVPRESSLANIGRGEETIFEIARNSVTLISPKIDQLIDAVPEAPQRNEKLLIFSDSISAAQCTLCNPQNIIAVDALQKAIVNLYGSQGSGQISGQNIISYTFSDLQDFVDNPFNRAELETNLSRSEWILFVTHSMNADNPTSGALHNLLAKQPEILRNRKVIVFSFGAPYYYDATEISTFSAYYGLFSKTPQFFEVAARILFQEIIPQGSSPVSVSGVAYDLIYITSPDANQIIELSVDETFHQESEVVETPEAPSEEDDFSVYNLGGNLPVKTGVILDHNGNPVPDGTVVRFLLSQKGENLTIQQAESTTTQGVARALIKLQNPGLHEIRASSEPALNSQILLLDISEEQGTIISAITPTPAPTIIANEIAEPSDLPAEISLVEPQMENKKIYEWILISLFAWASGAAFYSFADFINQDLNRGYISIAVVIGCLITGLWLVIGLPGSFPRIGFSGFTVLSGITLTGGFLTGLLSWMIIRMKASS